MKYRPPHPHRQDLSHWLSEALGDEEDQPRLEGEARADVCVVGGGYTGLWTALRLKELEPSLEVALIEADLCGAGPSGRNGGFVMTWWVKFLTLQKLCGTEEAVRLARMSSHAVGEIGDFCEKHGIDAHFRQDGWLWTATNQAQIGSWHALVEALERCGEQPYVELAPDEVAKRAGSSRHLAGIFEETVATVQPALLARGLRRVALDRGVRIFEHSPAVALEPGRPPRVRTDRGVVVAERVALALNAWTVQIPEFSRSLAVIATDMIVTEPIPDRLEQIGLRSGIAISDSRSRIFYYRTTRDGRIAFGKGGMAVTIDGRIGSRMHGRSPGADELAAGFHWLYPTLSDCRLVSSWTGPIDRSPTGVPFFTRLEGVPDVVCGAGYSGNGVGPSYVGGRILASLLLGRDDDWSNAGVIRQPAGRFPPEPVRFLGGRLIRSAITRKEAAEDAGREADRLSSWLAGLAPPGPSEPHRSKLLQI